MGFINTVRFLVTHPLGRRAPARAVANFVRWQLVSRISPGAIAVPFVGDSRLLVQRGMTGATGNVYVGLHEFLDMAFLLHLLRPGDFFLDVGANVGSYTILAAKVVGCDCLSVEPIAATTRRLRDNLALNEVVDRVDVAEVSVSARDGTVRMTTSQDTVNHVIETPHAGDGGTEVLARTIDGLLSGITPTLIKIDVEGHELPALQGARDTLTKSSLHACIVETLPGNSPAPEQHLVVELLVGYGFEIMIYDPWTRRLRCGAGVNAVGNTLFVRDRHWVETRLADAPCHTALGQTF